MRVYFGFVYGFEPLLIECGVRRLVATPVIDPDLRAPTLFPGPLDCLLDSGAFSVWNSGKTVDLDAYLDWAARYAPLVGESRVVNLDVIPGVRGKRPSAADQSAAVNESMANADYIRERGFAVTEVWHRQDPPELLDVLLRRRRDNEVLGIGIQGGKGSGLNGSAYRRLGDFVFGTAARFSGGHHKQVPMHGFGVAPDAPLAAYPWWSIDSTSWMAVGSFARAVTRSGRWAGNTGSDRRTSVPAVRALYMTRKLGAYLRAEDDLSALWDRRGVVYALDRE